MAKFKPRTSDETGKGGVVTVAVLRRQLRQTNLNESEDKGDVALFDFLDLQLDVVDKAKTDIDLTLKKTDPIPATQISGELPVLKGGSYSARYTPTLDDATNVTASVAFECYYQVIGSTVNVFGTFEVDPTAAALTQLGISLPVLSYFIDEGQCAGTASVPTVANEVATIKADVAGRQALVEWISSFSGVSEKFWFQFSYQLVAQP